MLRHTTSHPRSFYKFLIHLPLSVYAFSLWLLALVHPCLRSSASRGGHRAWKKLVLSLILSPFLCLPSPSAQEPLAPLCSCHPELKLSVHSSVSHSTVSTGGAEAQHTARQPADIQ